MTCIAILYTHYQSIMAPAQFATQCVANLLFGVCQIELAHIAKVGIRETIAKILLQSSRQPLENLLTIGSTVGSFLLLHYYTLSNHPIGGDHSSVYGAGGRLSCL